MMFNQKIFCVSSYTALGCTFLDWSIHFLSGQDKFFNIVDGILPISNNPIQETNAHAHLKNHPLGSAETLKVIQALNKSDLELNSFYPCNMSVLAVLENLSDIDLTLVGKNYERIKKYQVDDYIKSLKYCTDQHIPIIYIKMNTDLAYNMSVRSFDTRFLSDTKLESVDQSYTDLIDIFFKENFMHWSANNEFNLWDFREFLALNLRPYDTSDVDLNFNHFYLDVRDLWFNLEYNIIEIFKFLDLSIDSDRLKKWIPVYYQWQKQHLKILNFYWNIDTIVKFIINNQSLDLNRYDLDICREAVIQHELIYKHGLTIKGWGLEKFPNNAQDLHKLLEPNTYHQIEDIYNCLK